MRTQENRKVRVLSERDRVMERFKRILHRMKRIRKTGPRDDADTMIVKDCVSFTIGEVNRHNAEYEEFQESENADDSL